MDEKEAEARPVMGTIFLVIVLLSEISLKRSRDSCTAKEVMFSLSFQR